MKKNEVVIIGDQIIKDILGGISSVVNTILVNKLTKEEPLQVKFKRILELPIKKYIMRYNKGD